MSLEQRTKLIAAFFDKVDSTFLSFAKMWKYPENPGMELSALVKAREADLPDELIQLANRISERKTFFPPNALTNPPEILLDVIFGKVPRLQPLVRNFYESKEDGFYNFYIENFSNMYFLPDWLSALIQLRLNLSVDLTLIEVFREVIFIVILLFYHVIAMRATLAWFITINPYNSPLRFFIAPSDWVEEQFGSYIPSIGGVNLFITLFLSLIGIIGDMFNHIVFTMPFLPSEYEYGRTLINGETRDILIYRYFPRLWYDYPIPNDLREFWYYTRPEILDYMITTYKDTHVQFLPDQIINNTF